MMGRVRAFGLLCVAIGASAFSSIAPAPPACPVLPIPCDKADVQAPRGFNVFDPLEQKDDANGDMEVSTHPLITRDLMPHVNTHFHLGAEHRSAGAYDLEPPKERLADWKAGTGPRPGFFCPRLPPVQAETSAEQLLEPYDFQYCKDMRVGETYEVHWVYSTGGDVEKAMKEGLGGAFAREVNPMVIVQAQVFVVVNSDDPEFHEGSLEKEWNITRLPPIASTDQCKKPATKHLDFCQGGYAVSYVGSTTGSGFDNDKLCSPYLVSWMVDPTCNYISAKAFDETMCKKLLEHGFNPDSDDLGPHGSRELVVPKYAAKYYYKLPANSPGGFNIAKGLK